MHWYRCSQKLLEILNRRSPSRGCLVSCLVLVNLYVYSLFCSQSTITLVTHSSVLSKSCKNLFWLVGSWNLVDLFWFLLQFLLHLNLFCLDFFFFGASIMSWIYYLKMGFEILIVQELLKSVYTYVWWIWKLPFFFF